MSQCKIGRLVGLAVGSLVLTAGLTALIVNYSSSDLYNSQCLALIYALLFLPIWLVLSAGVCDGCDDGTSAYRTAFCWKPNIKVIMVPSGVDVTSPGLSDQIDAIVANELDNRGAPVESQPTDDDAIADVTGGGTGDDTGDQQVDLRLKSDAAAPVEDAENVAGQDVMRNTKDRDPAVVDDAVVDPAVVDKAVVDDAVAGDNKVIADQGDATKVLDSGLKGDQVSKVVANDVPAADAIATKQLDPKNQASCKGDLQVLTEEKLGQLFKEPEAYRCVTDILDKWKKKVEDINDWIGQRQSADGGTI